MSQITTHILDTTKGKPAEAVTIILYQQEGHNWDEVSRGFTDSDGRISDLLSEETIVTPGVYKLKFETKTYFESQSIQTFYPYIEIVFEITASEHYHVPLLLTPFGYSTYRGS